MQDLSKAKKIFFHCLGSKVAIDREYGDKYAILKVPIEVENEWKKEIMANLKYEINNSSGYERFEAVNNYLQIVDHNEAIVFLIDILNGSRFDTFSIILILETLKQYLKRYKLHGLSKESVELIQNIINKYKEKLLHDSITIDKSYINSPYMHGYDFSDDSILNRIKML